MCDYHCELVMSLPGPVGTFTQQLTNLPRIQQILSQNPPVNAYSIERTKVVYLTSSINSINLALLYDLGKAIFCDNIPDYPCIKINKQSLLNCFQIVYPSANYVAGSYFGEAAAKCLFLRRNEYERCKFEKSVLKKFEGNASIAGSATIISHSKVFVVLNDGVINDDTTIYIGSHNLTKAAWGIFDYKNSKANGFNYELGIIIPPRKGSKNAKESLIKRLGVDISPPHYGADDRPYFSSE